VGLRCASTGGWSLVVARGFVVIRTVIGDGNGPGRADEVHR
jgi:hypothetical protein